MKLICLVIFLFVFCISCSPKKEDLNKDLIRFARERKVEDVRRTLDLGADINARDEKGRTALIIVSTFNISGDNSVQQLLLLRGADINATDKFGRTALIQASFESEKGAVDLFLANGANPNIQDNNGDTALDCANIAAKSDNAHNSKYVLEQLRKYGAKTKAELQDVKSKNSEQ